MEEFATLEKVKELFEKVDFIGEENCFIYALTNTQKPAPSGLLGGMVAGMEAAQKNRGWSGYLINKTEKGIGLIPLKSKSTFVIKPENMIPQLDKFILIDNGNIESVKIKKLGFISPVAKTVDIKIKNDEDFNLVVRNKEKLIPYHEENFAKFIEIYKN